MRRIMYAAIAVAIVATPAAGQHDNGPGKGTWGVEASSRLGGSLLRFRSPVSAWVMQLAADYEHIAREGRFAFLTPARVWAAAFNGFRLIGSVYF